MEEALNARNGHLLPDMAEGVVDFTYGRQYAGSGLPPHDTHHTKRTLEQPQRKLTSSAELPSDQKTCCKGFAKTAFHAASQRSQAVFLDRKAKFAKYTNCAMRPYRLT
ncbi:hypothetical protein DS909_09810 [Phaeobacter gallaeciensis]|uniref:Uncharacterized protein n=1 Tax=Phaeobacter gallaeciensis TaxID=60890 RepID=A0A366X471_9RHOB|nr:hypothetical protein DS909_09810 [Phaeobacter gallaeciensis]